MLEGGVSVFGERDGDKLRLNPSCGRDSFPQLVKMTDDQRLWRDRGGNLRTWVDVSRGSRGYIHRRGHGEK